MHEGGLSLCTALAGFGGFSTRAELAAGIVTISADRAVHLGTDSQAFLDKAHYVLDLCRRGKQPKKPWGIHADGDLWEAFHDAVKAKGHKSIAITKVKGHATEDMVIKGKVKTEDKEGNDFADKVAVKAIAEHGKKL